MTDSLDNKLNVYYDEIYSLSPCSKNQKRKLLDDLKKEVEEYVESFSVTDIDEIRSVFGSPEDIAAGFAEGVTVTEIKKKYSLRKIVTVFLAAALLVWAIFALISFIDVHTEANGYFSEAILCISGGWRGGVL